MAILTILSVPIQERRISIYLDLLKFLSVIFFFVVFKVQVLYFSDKLFLKYFVYVFVIILVFLISFSDCSLLVYRNTTFFCILSCILNFAECFPPTIKNKTDVRPNHLCSTLYYMQISLGKGDNSVKMVKDKVTLFRDDIISYIENPKKCQKNKSY